MLPDMRGMGEIWGVKGEVWPWWTLGEFADPTQLPANYKGEHMAKQGKGVRGHCNASHVQQRGSSPLHIVMADNSVLGRVCFTMNSSE